MTGKGGEAPLLVQQVCTPSKYLERERAAQMRKMTVPREEGIGTKKRTTLTRAWSVILKLVELSSSNGSADYTI